MFLLKEGNEVKNFIDVLFLYKFLWGNAEDLQKCCEAKDAESCAKLGLLYALGEEINRDFSKAVEFFSQACELENSLGCFYLGSIYDRGMGVKKISLKPADFMKNPII